MTGQEQDIHQETHALRKRFDALLDDLQRANTDVMNGRLVSLPDLEKTVEALCQETVSKQPAIARDLQPLMAEAISPIQMLCLKRVSKECLKECCHSVFKRGYDQRPIQVTIAAFARCFRYEATSVTRSTMQRLVLRGVML